jgi:hypothetical protein
MKPHNTSLVAVVLGVLLTASGATADSRSRSAGETSSQPLAARAPASASPRTNAAPTATRPATPEDDRRYRARAAASPEAKQFRGGALVVISAGALALILAIVLLVVLI